MKKSSSIRLVVAALLTALGVLLPMVFHWFNLGWTFLPMHLPVLLCGLICGAQWGGLCGLVVPLLSSFFTGMPVLYPTGISMMAELAVYGFVAGWLTKRVHYALALVGAMIAGRVVGIAVTALLAGVGGQAFVLMKALNSNFVMTWPGILIQLIAIPVILEALTRAKLVPLK